MIVPRVLVSYVNDDAEHTGRVLDLARLLRGRKGIETVLDLWARDVHRDWSEWLSAELAAATHVLLVGSPEYRRLSESAVSSNALDALHVTMLKQRSYGAPEEWLSKVIPVLLPGGTPLDLPDFARPGTSRLFEVDHVTAAGVDELCRLITGQPEHLKPVLGRTAPGLPRVVAEDRAALAPMTLAPVTRPKLLDTALSRRTKREGDRQALVLTGEGGVGKSVLLGQLLDRLASAPNGSAVLLVSAASVPAGTALDQAKAVDLELGVAAHDEWGASGLLALLRALREEHGGVTLLLDTLDLLIDERSRVPIASVLARALGVGDVVLTCRTVEFGRHLSESRTTAPRLTGRLADFAVPPLNEHEILTWASDHVAGLGSDSAEQAAFLESLAGGLRSRGSLREVCALPVRLALTCQVFGRGEHVPEDLTVTGLYDAYWDTRVRRDPSGGDDEKERAALDVAALVVGASGEIALRVPKGRLANVDDAGLRMLASEGVLHDRGTSWEFFHQTFAEYGHARGLRTRGMDSPEVERFTGWVAEGRGTLWPIATSLLLQADDDEYRSVVGLLPADTLDGAKSHALGALQRSTPDSLNSLLDDLSDRPSLLRVVVPALGEAPTRHLERAVALVSNALRAHPGDLADVAVAGMVTLLARTDSTAALSGALTALAAAKPSLEREAWDHYGTRLLEARPEALRSAETRAVALDEYRRLGPLGQRAVLRLHLARADDLSDEDVVRLADDAFAGECPPLTDAEAVAVFRLFWRSPGVRAKRDWSGWTDLLAATLPKGWNNGQVKFVVAQAVADPVVADEVVDDLVLGRSRTPEAHVNVFHQLAERFPRRTAARVLEHPVPTTLPALSAITRCTPVFARELDLVSRKELALRLLAARESAPRDLWRAVVSLMADDVEAHRALLAEVEQADLPGSIRRNVILTWYANTPRPALDELLPELRALTADGTGELRRIRTHLEGRVVDTDRTARDWVRTCLLDQPSPVVAGTAVQAVVEHFGVLPTAVAEWLAPLLATRHTDAAERLAALLAAQSTTSTGLADLLVPVTVERMEDAAARRENSNLSRTLLHLVVTIDSRYPIAPEDVRRVHRTVRSRLPLNDPDGVRDNDHSAAFRDLTRLAGTLMARRLPVTEVRELVDEVLEAVDPRALGKKMDRSVLELLRGFAVRDPDAVDWMDDLFGEPRVADVVKLAIAKVFVGLDGGAAAGGRAARLRDRPDCPQEVAEYLVTALRS